jgi:DNA-binding CsgD family transcriptional regulator
MLGARRDLACQESACYGGAYPGGTMPASKATIEQVSREIRTIHAMLRRLARAVVQFAPAVAGAELEPGARVVGAGSLTLREQQVLRLIAAGKTSREIGRLFKISPRTVDSHRGSLMLKLGIHNTAGLVRYALQHPGAKQRRRRRLQLTPARRAALRLQGQYMGTMRGLSRAQKAKVRKIRDTKGIRAAIAAARRLAG